MVCFRRRSTNVGPHKLTHYDVNAEIKQSCHPALQGAILSNGGYWPGILLTTVGRAFNWTNANTAVAAW